MNLRERDILFETRRLRSFQRKADRICGLILSTDLPWVDIEIRIEQLRQEAARIFPGKDDLFALIYDSRFARLRRQWRG